MDVWQQHMYCYLDVFALSGAPAALMCYSKVLLPVLKHLADQMSFKIPLICMHGKKGIGKSTILSDIIASLSLPSTCGVTSFTTAYLAAAAFWVNNGLIAIDDTQQSMKSQDGRSLIHCVFDGTVKGTQSNGQQQIRAVVVAGHNMPSMGLDLDVATASNAATLSRFANEKAPAPVGTQEAYQRWVHQIGHTAHQATPAIVSTAGSITGGGGGGSGGGGGGGNGIGS
jgi:hypothetical protein